MSNQSEAASILCKPRWHSCNHLGCGIDDFILEFFGLLCTAVLIGWAWDPATSPLPRIWARVRGRNWSAQDRQYLLVTNWWEGFKLMSFSKGVKDGYSGQRASNSYGPVSVKVSSLFFFGWEISLMIPNIVLIFLCETSPMNYRRADLQLWLPLNVDVAVLLDLREQFTIGVFTRITEKIYKHRTQKLMYVKLPMYLFFVLI